MESRVPYWMGGVAGALALIAYLPYFRSILRGRTRPARASWAIWTLLSALTLVGHWQTGARASIWLPLGQTLPSAMVLFLAIRHGVGGWARLDVACLLGAAVGLVVLIASESPVIGLVAFLLTDLLALLPTLRKSISAPHTEDRTSWSLTFAACGFNLFAITDWGGAEVLHPLYFLFASGSVTACLWFAPTPAASLQTGG